MQNYRTRRWNRKCRYVIQVSSKAIDPEKYFQDTRLALPSCNSCRVEISFIPIHDTPPRGCLTSAKYLPSTTRSSTDSSLLFASLVSSISRKISIFLSTCPVVIVVVVVQAYNNLALVMEYVMKSSLVIFIIQTGYFSIKFRACRSF